MVSNRYLVVGVFPDRSQARKAVAELRRVGFGEDQIGILAHDDERDDPAVLNHRATHAEEGAAAGVVAGAGLGTLWGLAIIAGLLPAIGPVIAGGTLAAILASAAAGAAAAGLLGALVGLGIPEDEAEFYERQFRWGHTLVTVKANGRAETARAILARFGSYDYETSESEKDAAPAGGVTPHTVFDMPIRRDDVTTDELERSSQTEKLARENEVRPNQNTQSWGSE